MLLVNVYRPQSGNPLLALEQLRQNLIKNGSPKKYEFVLMGDLSSIEEALARVVNGCNWVTGS